MYQTSVMDERITYLASQIFHAYCHSFHYGYPSFQIWDFGCMDLAEDDFSCKTLAET